MELISYWFLGIPVAFFSLCILLRSQPMFVERTKKDGNANDLMAFLITALFCVMYIPVASFMAFFNGSYAMLEDNRFYGRSEFVENHLLFPMFFFQFWSFVLCCFNVDLNDTVMLIHHFLCGALAYIAIFPIPHLQYYAIVFWSVEITNIPLTGIKILKLSTKSF